MALKYDQNSVLANTWKTDTFSILEGMCGKIDKILRFQSHIPFDLTNPFPGN